MGCRGSLRGEPSGDDLEVVPVLRAVEGVAVVVNLLQPLDVEAVEENIELSGTDVCGGRVNGPAVSWAEHLAGEPAGWCQRRAKAPPQIQKATCWAVRQTPPAVDQFSGGQLRLGEVGDTDLQAGPVLSWDGAQQELDSGCFLVHGEHLPSRPQECQRVGTITAAEVDGETR